MNQTSQGMHNRGASFTDSWRWPYWGLLGVSLVVFSLGQMQPVRAQADATGALTEQVTSQSRESASGKPVVAAASSQSIQQARSSGLPTTPVKRDLAGVPSEETTQNTEKQADSGTGTDPTNQREQQSDLERDSAAVRSQSTDDSPSHKRVTSASTAPTAGTITVHYYQKGTTHRLAPDDELSVTTGQTYAATPKAIRHYRLVNQVTTTGTYSDQAAAYFYYETKTYQVKIKYQVKLSASDQVFAGTKSSAVTWKTKVLQVPYGQPYTIPVLNFEDDGLYVIKKQLPKSLTGIMGDQTRHVTISYGSLSVRTVFNRQNDSLIHYSTDPNGVLRYAELDENEASHTLLMFTFPQNGKRIEVEMISNISGDHTQKFDLAEGQKVTVTLLDGSRHIIRVKNGVIYDRLLTGSKQAIHGANGAATATSSRVSGQASFKAAQTASDHQEAQGSAQLPQTADRTNPWLSVLGLGLLVLANMPLLLRKLKRG
ncbi:MucBP domain-containing protein [Levilactobacillus hammesii]|uniref:MucBP domain-containing protein n=1 Tax=Levilactobacillus hammesii DSM 16381 TaxID=1423753 RepID=A0A0R1UK17_9LACO|nr:MucBP domain-containing protein [Levilactobacillus hammesii]KRL93644.1 hypothetical protein FD28_GL000826 [Levilactobacillus hammesii DSM 16381]